MKFNDKRDITNYIKNTKSILPSETMTAIWNASVYYTQIEPQKNAFDAVVSFLMKISQDFHYESYAQHIETTLRKAKKYKMKLVENISFTKSEMEYIASFGSLRKEKIVFVILTMAKYFNCVSEKQGNKIFMSVADIFKMARVAIAASLRGDFLGFAFDCGLLDIPFYFGNDMYIVNAPRTEEDDEIVLTLIEEDFLELGFTYVNYKQGGYKRCQSCGRWFKYNKRKRRTSYCPLHREKNNEKTYKEIKCIDCGTTFFVIKQNKRTCRCIDCQAESRKKSKKDWYYRQNLDR